MKLYSHFERVDKELELAGFSAEAPLTAALVGKWDNMNYHGSKAVDHCIKVSHMIKNDVILDCGSGLGGPARYMASEVGAHVTALEMQEDCSSKAESYTRRCSLGAKVTHIHGNFMECDISQIGDGLGSYTLLTSWLVFLHINDKLKLFERCQSMLAPSVGRMYIEDFYIRAPFNEELSHILSRDVYCDKLETKEEYIATLNKAGFTKVDFDDMTEDWTAFVTSRRDAYVESRERVLSVHGEPTYNSQLLFFNAMVTLFESKALGGVRILASQKEL